jgi:hypothetical protein
MRRRERSAEAIRARRPLKRFEEIQRETFSKVSLCLFFLLSSFLLFFFSSFLFCSYAVEARLLMIADVFVDVEF